MKFDTTKAMLAGLLFTAFSLLLTGCGNKGDLVLVRKPAAVDVPSPVSVPEEQEQEQTRVNTGETEVKPDGVVLDISEVIPKKKKTAGE